MTGVLAAAAPFVIVGAICLLVGAAVGHHTGGKDAEREANERSRKRAGLNWQAGYEVGHAEGWAGSPMRPLSDDLLAGLAASRPSTEIRSDDEQAQR